MTTNKPHAHTALTKRILSALAEIGDWLMGADAERDYVVRAIRANQSIGAEQVARACLAVDVLDRHLNELLFATREARESGYCMPDEIKIIALLTLNFAEGELCEQVRLSELSAVILAGMNLRTGKR